MVIKEVIVIMMGSNVCKRNVVMLLDLLKDDMKKKISKDSNKHAFISYINRKLNCKSGIGSLLKRSDGMRIGGNKEIAEALNSYFC